MDWNVKYRSGNGIQVSQLINASGIATDQATCTAPSQCYVNGIEDNLDTLNNYFSTVFEVEPDEPLPEFENRTFTQPLEDISIINSIVDKVLSALNAGKSQGPDQIHPKFLKETKDLLIEPLKIIFQKSLNENTLPAIWKKANVSAIF